MLGTALDDKSKRIYDGGGDLDPGLSSRKCSQTFSTISILTRCMNDMVLGTKSSGFTVPSHAGLGTDF